MKKNKSRNNESLGITNAIANAGIRGRRNIWNLYLHLCCHEKAEQFNPALAIASTVVCNLSIAM